MLKWNVTSETSKGLNSSQNQLNQKTDIEKLIEDLEKENNVDHMFTTKENIIHKTDDNKDNEILEEKVIEDQKHDSNNKDKTQEPLSDIEKVIEDLEKESNVDHIFTIKEKITHKAKDNINNEILEKRVKEDEKFYKDKLEEPPNENEKVIESENQAKDIVDGVVDRQPDSTQDNLNEAGADPDLASENNKTPIEEDDVENENIPTIHDNLKEESIKNESLEESIVEHKNMIDNKLDEILSSLNSSIETSKNENKSPMSEKNENIELTHASQNTEANNNNDDLDKVLETLHNTIHGDNPESKKENAVRDKKKFERRNSVNVDTNGFGKCAGCGNPLSDSALMVGADYYHQGCFTCHKCGVNLAGKFYPVEGKNYCEKDWLDGLEKCSQCEKPMQTGSVNVNNKKYHPECFVCVICRNPLEGAFFNSADGPLCENDYKESREKCFICGLPLTGRIVSALNNKYHPACFSCVICEKILDGKPFLSEGTSIYCTNCYARLKGKQCHACGNGIMSTKYKKAAVVTVNGRSYHQECVNCKDCGKNLKGQTVFSAGEDDLLCLDDHMRREKLAM